MPDFHTSIIKPIVTEKSTSGNKASKYTFLIAPQATKIDIKKAIQTFYGEKVKHVRVINLMAKSRMGRRRGLTIQKRTHQKKAIVTLKAGKTIDVNKPKEKK